MIEQLKAVYTTDNRVKVAAFVGLLLCAVIFAVLSGGFPPWAWRFLFFTALPNLPFLMTQQGGAVFLPLLGLILLSLSLLIVWVVLVTLMLKIATHLWRVYYSRQSFNMDLREAEQLAEQNLASDELDRWFEGGETPGQRPPLHISGATSALHSTQANVQPGREYVASARVARVSGGGGPIYPETPTPISNPIFCARTIAPATRERPGVWTQQRSRQNGEQGAGRAYNTTSTASTASTAKAASLPLSSAPPNPARKQLRIVPPPPFEESPAMEIEQASNSAFSTPPERGQVEQPGQDEQGEQSTEWLVQPAPPGWLEQLAASELNKQPEPAISSGWLGQLEQLASGRLEPLEQPGQSERSGPSEQFEQRASSERPRQFEQSVPLDISRYPTYPERNEAKDVPNTAMLEPFRQSGRSTSGRSSSSVVQAPSVDPYADFDPSTDSDAQINIYDTIPFDENKILKASSQSEADGMPRLVVGIGLDPGIKRRNAPNEDSIFAIQGMRITDNGSMPAGLFVIADGMGGHANGREASRMAIHTVSDVVVPALLRDVSGRDAAEEETIFQDMLKDGVHRANLSISRRNRETKEMMGTTLTAALIVNSTAYIGNVGDSRTYLYRPSEGLRQITRDHSEVARMVESGAITPAEIYTHPQRNRIYRCLGERASVDMDLFTQSLLPGDVLILCSDGLWEMVRDAALEKLIAASAHNPTQMSAILVQAALNHGGLDNISVVVVGFLQAEE